MPRTCCTSSIRRAPPANPKGIVHTTGGYLVRHLCHDEAGVRSPGRRCVLVHRRHRLGDRPQLRRLRPARERRDGADVRGGARLAAEGSILVAHRALRRHHFLHRADGHSRVHAMGRRVARPSTTCRRCGCIGSVGEPINPEAWIWYHRVIGGERCPVVDTWWQTETGAIMITPLPGVTTIEARIGHAAVSRHRRRDPQRERRNGRRRRRPARAHAAVAVDAARHLRRSGTIRPAVLEQMGSRRVRHRRRRQARRRRHTSGCSAAWTT